MHSAVADRTLRQIPALHLRYTSHRNIRQHSRPADLHGVVCRKGREFPENDVNTTAYQPEVLVLDFAGVTFMDSSGIGLIMGRHRSMESIGGEVIVRNPPQHIRRVMRLSGMDRIARIQMDAPAAQPEEPAERRDEQ